LARRNHYVGLSKIREVGNDEQTHIKVYECYPQLTSSQSLIHFKRVNDAFTMYITRMLQGNTALRISTIVMNEIIGYGRWYI